MNEQDYLMHYGVKGMKWGVRRYQNLDGTRTSLGRQHEAELKGRSGSSFGDRAKATAGRVKSALTSDKAKKAYKIAGVAVGVAAVAGAAYLYSKNRGAVNSIVKNAASRTLSSTKSAASRGKSYINQAMSKVSKTAKNVAAKTKMSEKEFMDQKTIRSKVLNNGIKAREAVQNAAKKVDNATRSMRGAAAQKADNIAKNVSKTASKVSSAAKKAKQSVGMNAAAAADIARNKAKNIGSAIKDSQAARSAYGAATKAGSAVKGAVSKAGQTAQSVGSSAVKAGRTYTNNAGRAVKKASSAVKGAASTARSAAKSAASRAGTTASKAKSVVTKAASNAKSGVKDFANKASSKASKIGTKSIEREKAKNHGVYSKYRAAPGATNREKLYEYMRKKGLMR